MYVCVHVAYLIMLVYMCSVCLCMYSVCLCDACEESVYVMYV